MELPPPRPIGTEGRKATHDFLSLYSPVQQDPRSPQGGYLKTHDFLLPLERVGKNTAKEENQVEVMSAEKPPPPAPPPSVEHLLPGGIGTYSISHISYINQRVPKPEGGIFTVAQPSTADRNEENSNCNSYTESGFTLWEESAVKKGKTGKENIAADEHIMRDVGMKIVGGQRTSLECPSQSYSNHNNHSNSFSSFSSSQSLSARKNQSFIDMIKSAKSCQDEDDDDDEDELVIKKEPSSLPKGNLTIKVDGKSTDPKANTPRSKHSATEQRRRSKINDRFQMLRGLIPNSDQKRDKASFLLEVIEYIQFLQEKVHKYEGSYQGWTHEQSNLIPWTQSNRPTEGFIDQSRGASSGTGPVLMFPAKLEGNITDSPTISRSRQNPVESEISTATTLRAMDLNSGLVNKAVPPPIPLHHNTYPRGNNGAHVPPRLLSDAEHTGCKPTSQLWPNRSCISECTLARDKLKEQELTIKSGTISVSTVYSQGLLNKLTQALQSSGVDLSQASISVQIDLGKQSNCVPNSSASKLKTQINDTFTSQDDDALFTNGPITRSRMESPGDESDQATKKLRSGRN